MASTLHSKMTQIKKLEKINEGGFGVVYKCVNEHNRELAVKCINTDKNGVPCLMETSIMSTIDHPCINRAIQIYIEPRRLYIIQEKAQCDLKTYVKSNISSITRIQYIKWFNMLVRGVNVMHDLNILHGDIKATNILLYTDMSIKLSDFTLSKIIDWKTDKKLYTASHRSIEAWNDQSCFKSDIWALGCTFYEILLGHNLFYSQNKDMSIKAIKKWAMDGPNKEPISDKIYDGDYKTPNMVNCINQNQDLLDMSFAMLYIDRDKRPTINEILKCSLFDENYSSISYKNPLIKINKSIKTQIKRNLEKYCLSKKILKFITKIYVKISKLQSLRGYNDKLKIYCCAWIATKLVNGQHIDIDPVEIRLNELYKLEREICDAINFSIHDLYT